MTVHDEKKESRPPLHAVIGVRHQGSNAYYVRRSSKMTNYPNVWSLLSIQFLPAELPDHLDLVAVATLMRRMSEERLGGIDVTPDRYLASATCSDNPMRQRVTLHLYSITFNEEPVLSQEFYTEASWLTPTQYEEKARGATCGLCMRLWSDYCLRHRLTEKPFAPRIADDDDDDE